MKSFFSIIRISPNINSGDSIAIGLVLKDRNKIYFQFSETKKNLVQRLISTNDNTIDIVLKQLSSKIDESNKSLSEDQVKLIESRDIFSSEYFEYLSQYSNGLIQFDSPKVITDAIDENKFKNLYSLFIEKVSEEGSFDFQTKKSIIFKNNIEEKLINRVRQKVHTNYPFDSKLIPSLYFHFEMDAIGRNGIIIGAKSIDFNKLKKQSIDIHISHYYFFISNIKRTRWGSVKDNFFLISDEPSSINSDEHKIWEAVKKDELWNVIDSENTDKIADIIESSNAQKFLDFED